MPFWKKQVDGPDAEVPDVPGLQDLAEMDVSALMDQTPVRDALPVFAVATVLGVGEVIDNEIVGEVYPIDVSVAVDDDDAFEVSTSVLADTVVPTVGQRLNVSFHRHDATAVAVLGPA